MYELGIRSVCSVPLIAGSRIWGALNPSSKKENAFGRSEVEYLQQVANQIAAALQNAHAYREIAQLKDRLNQEKRYLESEIRSANQPDDIVGTSLALKRVLDYAAIVADTDSTVLITGETGTGKERIARVIHSMSRRKDRNFIKVNCAAIPTGLLESELFGHEKGAFTGAISQKLGRLELADKGTLLLDEVGEIPLELQPSCCAFCRTKSSSAWEERRRSEWTCGWSPPPIAIWFVRWKRRNSAVTCSTACTCFPCICRPCATAAKTSPC